MEELSFKNEKFKKKNYLKDVDDQKQIESMFIIFIAEKKTLCYLRNASKILLEKLVNNFWFSIFVCKL